MEILNFYYQNVGLLSPWTTFHAALIEGSLFSSDEQVCHHRWVESLTGQTFST